MTTQTFQSIVLNANLGFARNAMLEGRSYVVVPVVMIVEGVHTANNGDVYYPAEELAKTPMTWNMKPIVVYHPEIDGQVVSACAPELVEKYKVGLIMNSRWDASTNKLRAEAWIEVDRANLVDPRVMHAIENEIPMEVSTGVFSDNYIGQGNWNGESYTHTARNYRPDHLALLPDRVGACSMADGAGLLVTNALTHSDTDDQLRIVLRAKFGQETWLVDVFDKTVVFENSNKLWSLGYTKTKDVVALVDTPPVEVKRNTQYRMIDGMLVGNAAFVESKSDKETDMKKAALVDSLIANKHTSWKEEDRASLMTFNEDALEKMSPLAEDGDAKPKEDEDEDEPAPTEPAPAEPAPAEPAKTPDACPEPTANGAGSIEAAINSISDPTIREFLKEGARSVIEKKAGLITAITANEKNTLSADVLRTLDMPVLEGMAKMAAKEAKPTANGSRGDLNFLFSGQSTPTINEQLAKGQPKKKEPLGLPRMNFK